MTICSISKIKPEAVRRSSSGFSELDWLYGMNQSGNYIVWGLPQGKISLWAGAGGIGQAFLLKRYH